MAQPEAKKKVIGQPEITMDVMTAIRGRRAVRSYGPQLVDRNTINALLSAAVLAPTAFHEEPWSFAIIQDRDMLKQLSDAAKKSIDSETRERLPDLFRQADFNIFYNAGTLIVIYGQPMGPSVVADCWLAAENLMLTACSMGLGTCVIGMAVRALNTPEWKHKLGIPEDMTAYVPLILGVPDGETPPVPRKAPEIITWKL